ncbi:MAG: Rrf2 family transcriptional regulator [Lachnospiraceae bacterium]|jgi:DNA-binding IscR family transcriptional regulator
MQVSTKFTIAIHILSAVTYFQKDYKVTSDFLASSVGSNPVIIRNIMSQLRNAGIIEIRRGTGGISITRPLSEITFLDVYRAVETNSSEDLFRFHENTNPKCPVGRNIHKSLEGALQDIQKNFEENLSKHNVAEVYEGIVRAVKKESSAG